MPPPISILMPAYNAEKYIAQAIESILNQTFKDFEFIIVDDASTDKTWSIIQYYAKKDERIIILKNKINLKICKTLNRGIGIARGAYIVRMDADDWSFPTRIQKQYDYMESHKKIVVSGCSMLICDSQLSPYAIRGYPTQDDQLRKSILRYSPFSHPTIIFSTKIAKKVGGYHQLYSEDIEFYLNLGQYGNFGNMKDALIKYREVSTSMTFTKLKITEIHTIQHRVMAVQKLGYRFSIIDLVYNMFHFISIFTIPTRLKIQLFNRFRNKKIHNDYC